MAKTIDDIIAEKDANPKKTIVLEIYKEDFLKILNYGFYIYDKISKREKVSPLAVNRFVNLFGRTMSENEKIKEQVIKIAKQQCLTFLEKYHTYNFIFNKKTQIEEPVFTAPPQLQNNVAILQKEIPILDIKDGIQLVSKVDVSVNIIEFSAKNFLSKFFSDLECNTDFFSIIKDKDILKKYAFNQLDAYLLPALQSPKNKKHPKNHAQIVVVSFILLSFNHLINEDDYTARNGTKTGYIEYLFNSIKRREKTPESKAH